MDVTRLSSDARTFCAIAEFEAYWFTRIGKMRKKDMSNAYL